MSSFEEIYFWTATDDDTRETLRKAVEDNTLGEMLDETTAGFQQASNFKKTLHLHRNNLTTAGRCVAMRDGSIQVEPLV